MMRDTAHISCYAPDMGYSEEDIALITGRNPHVRVIEQRPRAAGKATMAGVSFSPEKRNKYGNRKTEYRGQLYDSKKEAHRAMELDMLVSSGLVSAWYPQHEFKFFLNGVDICSYIADFKVVYPDGHVEYEDVKGFKTAMYRLKKKMLLAFYGHKIKEI